jgi:hypothetical protein
MLNNSVVNSFDGHDGWADGGNNGVTSSFLTKKFSSVKNEDLGERLGSNLSF